MFLGQTSESISSKKRENKAVFLIQCYQISSVKITPNSECQSHLHWLVKNVGNPAFDESMDTPHTKYPIKAGHQSEGTETSV